jgi:hypothetical protein
VSILLDAISEQLRQGPRLRGVYLNPKDYADLMLTNDSRLGIGAGLDKFVAFGVPVTVSKLVIPGRALLIPYYTDRFKFVPTFYDLSDGSEEVSKHLEPGPKTLWDHLKEL